ncbi:aldo/keto reductase [Chromatiales bacterium (ex Bugula neritina AB1)]|nr:aldo/keto reductase [Chromatiales bacterium (ex Bugula neritina AB1)]
MIDSLGLRENPIVTGLWQVADLERGGNTLDQNNASDALLNYAEQGFHCFDMADHYGSAELIAGAARAKLIKAGQDETSLKLYTKWCPEPHLFSLDAVRAGIEERLNRLGVECIDLLQLHWWSFEHPGYIDVMDGLMLLKQEGRIKHIGTTNFDTDHLHVLLSAGFEVECNQVCLSVLDHRALGDMSQLCSEHQVKLLAYGTLAGGFLSDQWLNQPEPDGVTDWSKMKYLRFINATGGWAVFQQVMQALNTIAGKHGVSLANVAARWVIQQAAVAGVIVGARLTENAHHDSNRELLSLKLDETDMQLISEVSTLLTRIPGDCGSEYRQPPYLTASGDLSHHLNSLPKVYAKEPVPGRVNRWQVSSGSEYEPICGYSRAIRDGNRVMVSGTTATHGLDRPVGTNNPRAQTVYILDKIAASLGALGATMDDVVRTRIYLKDCSNWEAVSRVHGRYFTQSRPANTLLEVSSLVGPYDVEIEAEAVIP